jgi:hypothetical protein
MDIRGGIEASLLVMSPFCIPSNRFPGIGGFDFESEIRLRSAPRSYLDPRPSHESVGETPLTATFLVLLAVAWIAILLPAMVRARHSAPLATTERFKRGMEVLSEGPAPAGLGRAVNHKEELPKREDVPRSVRKERAVLFHVLVAAAVVTLVLAVVRQGGWWEIHTATDLTLAIYVAGLLEAQRRRIERRAKVRSITTRRTAPHEVPARARAQHGGT